jgi:glucose-6-phosphate isomerase
MTNALSARKWIVDANKGDESAVAKHFVAVSTAVDRVTKFGIDSANMFEFWEWVGGRYSVWSSIGLSVALYVGMSVFRQFLAGAEEMDIHFRSTKFDKNIPVLMAVIGVWYNNFMQCDTTAVLPYDQYMSLLPSYLQQADMESNGKYVTSEGHQVNYSTGPVLWGEAGTNGQHAFYQLIHQGTKIIPCDFILPIHSHNPISNNIQHDILVSNCFAQSEALAMGKTEEEVRAEMIEQKKTPEEIEMLVPHRTFLGNRPSNTLLVGKITPRTLGAIIAMYEHKIFVQGVIWDVNSYDQWGVELGKQLATAIQKDIQSAEPITSHDCSTNGLLNMYKSNK